MTDEVTDGTDPKKPVEAPPIHDFWHRLVHGADGHEGIIDRTKEVVRSIGRGVTNAITEGGDTIAAGAAYVDRKTGLGEKLTPGFNAAYDSEKDGGLAAGTFTQNAQGENVSDHYLGKRSDDPLASFTEGVTQFATGMAALGELKLAQGARAFTVGRAIVKGGNAAKVGIALAKGAAVDASLFNPYEAQLAELVSKIPNQYAKAVGDVFSVQGDDSQAVARLKRAAAGAIPGVALDGLVAGVRAVRALKVLRSGTATAVEQEAAQGVVAHSQETLQAINDGTHVPEGAHLKVEPTADGQFTIVPTTQPRMVAAIRFHDGEVFTGGTHSEAHFKAFEAQKPGALTVGETAPIDGFQLSDGRFLNREDATQHAFKNGWITADDLDAIPEGIPAERGRGMDSASLKFHDRIEATQQAETMNMALEARQQAGKPVDDATVNDVSKWLDDNLVSDPPALNVSQHNTVDQDIDLVKTLSDRIIKKQREIVGSEGALSVENSKALAKDNLALIPEDQTHEVIKGLLKANPESQSVVSVMADMVMGDKARTIIKLHDIADARPHDPVALEELTRAIQGHFELRDALYGPEADAARRLRMVQERPAMRQEEFTSGKAGETPVIPKDEPEVAPKDGETPATPPETVAGMQTRDASQAALDEATTRAIGRMFKLSGGAPRDVDAILQGAAVLHKGGTARAALEVFTNFLLSGPKTWLTVLTSGQALTAFEPLAKATGGVLTGNMAMVREAADTLYGAYAYLGDNVKIAAAAMREGHSIINPAPSTFAIGGLTGKIIRSPGNIMLGLDEFTRVSNYRAIVRAKSLRAGRELGLAGDALMSHVDKDMRAAFDPNTGIATLPQALKYADVATLSGGLTPGTFGSELQKFTNNAVAAKFVVPFVRASTNIFNYVWQSLPGLNQLNTEARNIMKAGGEEAAALQGRVALTTSIIGYTALKASQDEITGRGPSDPGLRQLWLDNKKQPYSIKIGDKWVSYQRMDPVATVLGLVADLHTFSTELGEKHPDTEDALYAIMASVTSNMASRTYMKGITDFTDAWGGGNPHSMAKWVQGFASNLAVPSLLNAVNPDPNYREVRTMMDAVLNRIPGFSIGDTKVGSARLDPRHNIFGEPTLKTDNVLNRGINPATISDAGEKPANVELLKLGTALHPFPDKIANGMIDLHDKTSYANGSDTSPYTRLMELVAHPANGGPSLRDAMTTLVSSDKWKNASDGTTDFKGGKRLILAQALKERYEQKAFQIVQREFPKLKQHIREVEKAQGASIRHGEDGVAKVESMFGAPVRR